jgi:apolipoprotein D and lipocalin family protein
MRPTLFAVAGVFVAAVLSGSALASAPQPAKPVPADLYSGRWYEIARTPNRRQNDCQGDTVDFSGWSAAGFSVVQTCHKGAPDGPRNSYKAHGAALPASDNAKMKLSFFGGFITQEYWIVDLADDHAWAIMATPAGHYVWLLSRHPVLDPEVQALALSRLRALGFDTSKLVFDEPPAATAPPA